MNTFKIGAQNLEKGIKYKDFILCNENSIEKKHCNNLIEYFEEHPRRQQKGLIGNSEFVPEIKNSTDIYFNEEDSSNLECKQLIDPFMQVLIENIEKYKNKYQGLSTITNYFIDQNMNLQRYLPGEGYPTWHCESGALHVCSRKLVWMFYLNDVKNNGETLFLHQNLSFKPKQGRLLIWPADWTHTHRGNISKKETKYIFTGWYRIWK